MGTRLIYEKIPGRVTRRDAVRARVASGSLCLHGLSKVIHLFQCRRSRTFVKKQSCDLTGRTQMF